MTMAAELDRRCIRQSAALGYIHVSAYFADQQRLKYHWLLASLRGGQVGLACRQYSLKGDTGGEGKKYKQEQSDQRGARTRHVSEFLRHFGVLPLKTREKDSLFPSLP